MIIQVYYNYGKDFLTAPHMHYPCSNLLLFHTTVSVNKVRTCLHNKCMGLCGNLTLLDTRQSETRIQFSQNISFKVFLLFCTVHPLLRRTFWHPRWRRFFPLARKGHFCRAKAFIRNNNAADWLTVSWSATKKQENEKKVVGSPEVCSGFSLHGRRVVELNVPAEALDGGCEA